MTTKEAIDAFAAALARNTSSGPPHVRVNPAQVERYVAAFGHLPPGVEPDDGTAIDLSHPDVAWPFGDVADPDPGWGGK